MLLGKLLLGVAVVLGLVWVLHILASEFRYGHVDVLSGDMLIMEGEKIQLEGIESIQIEQTCAFAKHKPWKCGRRAAQDLADFIGNNRVFCRPRSRYDGITHAACFRGVSDDLAEHQVENGWAIALPGSSYKQQQAKALSRLRGVWSSIFTPPSAWKRDHDSAAAEESS